MAEQAQKTSSGVRDLIGRLRDEGVGAGKAEAERLVAEAREQAARILADARAEADALRERTLVDVRTEREAAENALRLAARDTVLELREGVTRHFEQHVRRLVSKASVDEALLRSMILVLAGRAASDFVQDRDAEILVARMLGDGDGDVEDAEASEASRARSRDFILGITGTMLREGLELIPDDSVGGGARVRVRGEEAEIDLSDEAVGALLVQHLLPRFQAILQGTED